MKYYEAFAKNVDSTDPQDYCRFFVEHKVLADKNASANFYEAGIRRRFEKVDALERAGLSGNGHNPPASDS